MALSGNPEKTSDLYCICKVNCIYVLIVINYRLFWVWVKIFENYLTSHRLGTIRRLNVHYSVAPYELNCISYTLSEYNLVREGASSVTFNNPYTSKQHCII
jgi:hypothetical protein